MTTSPPPGAPVLQRRLGLGGAVAIGLAAMLGTGVFAAWTPALAWAGPKLLWSLLLAAVVAALNAWSTAALARQHPEAGGAYAYGRIRLGRAAGIVAGAAFVIGKVASAGAAALTVGTYISPANPRVVALVAIAAVLLLDLRGVTRTAWVSAATSIVVIAVLVMLTHYAPGPDDARLFDTSDIEPRSPGAFGILAASGLLFVAFAGYARIATLGEEVRNPRRILPWAIALSFGIVLVVYLRVAVDVVTNVGPLPLGERSTAPLVQVAESTGLDSLVTEVRVAAVVAAGGALLSLLAGVGRTLFAMARGSDAPAALTAVSRYGVPHRAQLVAGAGAAAVALVGGIGAALAVSGFSILAYYGVAHLAALRLTREEGRPPRVMVLVGLVGCVVVAGSLVVVGLGLVSPTS